jgi:small subunit ribosomal protein S8
MQEKQLIGSYEIVEDGKGGIININLLGNLNDCGVIKPRHRVKVTDLEKFEKRYLPAMGFGILIISTNQGLMTNAEAKEKNIGGTLISYAY